jgi:uncharacterized membrane protein
MDTTSTAAPKSLSAPVSRASSTAARFSPRTRKLLLLFHIISSMTWLGVDVGLLALSLTGYLSDDPVTVRAVYLSMNVLAFTVVIPVSLLALVTGVVLGLGTKWGLVRYHWVLVKLVITLITVGLTLFLLRPGLQQAAADIRVSPVLPDGGTGLLFPPIVSLTCYVFMTVISIYKPWGRTRRSAGKR